MSFHAFHWPDHNIGKRESRRIREEHNALFNSHAELVTALEQLTKEVHIGELNVRKDFSLMNAHACATKALHNLKSTP